jgi:hypothetical protein
MIDKITKTQIRMIRKGFNKEHHVGIILSFVIDKINEIVISVNKSEAERFSAKKSTKE